MKKLILATLLAVLGCSACGSIHVGNVKFSSKDICSAEYSDWYRPNSSCLPPARVSNVQSYYMESKRLPIPGDEARRVDRAAELEDAAYALSPLQLAVAEANALRVSIEKFQNAVAASQKAISDAKKANDMPDISTAELDDLSSYLTGAKAKDAANQLQNLPNLLREVAAIPDELTTVRESLKTTQATLANFTDPVAVKVAKSELVKKGDALSSLTKRPSDVIAEQPKLTLWKDQSGKFSSAVEATDGDTSKLPGADLRAEYSFKAKDAIDKLRAKQAKLASDFADPKKTTDEKKTLETKIARMDAILSPAESVFTYAEAIAEGFNETAARLNDVKTAMDEAVTGLAQLSTPTSLSSSEIVLNRADGIVAALQQGIITSTLKANLLPSLIGRVFVADVIHPSPVADGEYKMPGNGGNLELLAVKDWEVLEAIPTEVQVKTDISGVVRKQMGASASFNASQLLTKITTPKITPDLKAVMQATLASLDTGTGHYYYVSMTSKNLDELADWLHEHDYMANIPPGRGDAKLKDEAPYKSCVKHTDPPTCNSPLDELRKRLGLSISDSRLSKAPGLGIIVGAAILRTRKGASEVCSTLEITLSKDGRKLDANKSGSPCSELRSILEGSNVPPIEISAALATVNAAYRSESYKTMLIHDHASVLALQWIPIKLSQK